MGTRGFRMREWAQTLVHQTTKGKVQTLGHQTRKGKVQTLGYQATKGKKRLNNDI